jgi:hypothetical protein
VGTQGLDTAKEAVLLWLKENGGLSIVSVATMIALVVIVRWMFKVQNRINTLVERLAKLEGHIEGHEGRNPDEPPPEKDPE